MEFRVLGRLEAWRDGLQLALGPRRQRSLLALLLIHANQVVSTDRIIDELWGDESSADRQNALWVNVSNLRSVLEPEREKRSEGTLVMTRAPGYLLQVEPDGLDAWRFEELLREARMLVESDPAAASIVLTEALTLWRGRPFEDFAYESFAQARIAELDELRLEAVELRIDADLRRGLAAELVGELEGLARQHPLREHLTALLMLALHRSGRRADALRAYGRLRTRLAEELGIDPSASLQALEAQMLVDDPDLQVRGDLSASPTRLGVRGYELREQLGEGHIGVTFRAYQPAVGREVAVKVTRTDLANDAAFIRRFDAEAELVARLEHPHIVPLYDYWREPDAAYLVTRLFRGGSLDDAVLGGPLDPAALAQIVSDVGSALDLAHRSGVVHGNVKPANILLDDRGRAYLTDFAIATDSPADPEAPAPVVAARASPFAAPEQDEGAEVTPRSDIYSLGAVVAFCLKGNGADTPVPAPLAEVLARATTTDPEARYHDAASFAEEVGAALGSPVEEIPAGPVANPYKGLRAFEEADASDFFGRERQVERLLGRLGGYGDARPLHRRGRSERQREVERRPRRPRTRTAPRRSARIGGVVRRHDDAGERALRGPRSGVVGHRRRPAGEPARGAHLRRGGHPACCRSRPARPASSPPARHRPVRGALHPGRGASGAGLPRCPGRGRRRAPQPAADPGHAPGRLLRPSARPPGRRRAAAPRDGSHHTHGAR
jgi:DNA-binding SARP family transcriptional activator/tRNA A-37 threonylcarbamoyl transferase component Bud32